MRDGADSVPAEDPRAVHGPVVGNRISIVIDEAQGMDELALPFGARPDLLRQPDLLLRNGDCRRHKRRIP